MEAGASYPELSLGEELITYVESGSATCVVGNKTYELSAGSLLYLTSGAKRSLKAGPDGLKALDVFSPVRTDHLKLAGVHLADGADVGFPDQGVTPNIEAGTLYNLNEIQFTGLTAPDESKPYPRSAANARLVWGKNVMLSFVRMDPGSSFPWHIHPEDQLMIATRGSLEEGIMGSYHPMSGDKRSVLLQPGGMAHSANMGEHGADAIDVFWPVRPDYIAKYEKQMALYNQVVAPGVKPKHLSDGFIFTEGGVWRDGSFYFTDMFFTSDWKGDPAQSRLIKMAPDGAWTQVTKGMQNNGTILSRDGNIILCDMFGHRVVEVNPDTGEVLRTLLDSIDGKPIDGPNDLVMDSKGGIYVSDPQFTPDEKQQPGPQVYYIAPDGSARVVIAAGNYAFPNGVALSPDGKTFYVNNTWMQPGDNFVWAYDVQDDGSLTNKRQFAMLHLEGEVLSAEKPVDRVKAVADGMAVDTDGRLYVTTLSGVQIFQPDGIYIGTIPWRQNPANCAFGGVNGNVLYILGGTLAWAIETNVKGFQNP